VQPLKGCNNAKNASKPCSCGGRVWVCRQRFLLGSTGQLAMTNEQALQAGTIAPAEMQEKSLGSSAPATLPISSSWKAIHSLTLRSLSKRRLGHEGWRRGSVIRRALLTTSKRGRADASRSDHTPIRSAVQARRESRRSTQDAFSSFERND